MSRDSSSSSGGSVALAVVGIIVLVLIFAGSCIASNSNRQTQVCTVTEKDRTSLPKGGSDMRIYTEDCGTLSVADNWANGIMNSADVYAQIKPGNTYEFETVGFRVPIISGFPTIVEVTPVDS